MPRRCTIPSSYEAKICPRHLGWKDKHHGLSADFCGGPQPSIGSRRAPQAAGRHLLPSHRGQGRQGPFRQAHIEGAQFFDIDAVCTPSDLPHTAPSPEIFAQAVGELGISAEDTVVVYDQKNLFSAPRVWWTFRMFGHENVLVLNGGLPAWLAQGFATVSGLQPAMPLAYRPKADLRTYFWRTRTTSAALDAGHPVADARPTGRFTGAEKEPRAGMRSGHMPGATSVPLSTLIDANGELVPLSQIEAAFSKVDSASPIITSCGSGVTAAGLSLGLHEIGLKSRVYDGSWSEWGRESADTVVVTGEL